MKIGDLIKYPYWSSAIDQYAYAIVLKINEDGGTTKAHILSDGRVGWLVTSDCEVINESR